MNLSYLAVVLFSLVGLVFSSNNIEDHFINTVFDQMDQKLCTEDDLKAVRQVYVSGTTLYDAYGKEFEVVSWASPQTIYNYSFTANAQFTYQDGGAGKQYLNLRIKSSAGQVAEWQGEIWTY